MIPKLEYENDYDGLLIFWDCPSCGCENRDYIGKQEIEGGAIECLECEYKFVILVSIEEKSE